MGKVMLTHAVNNGPIAPNVRGVTNFELYKAAGIPYARNHDASFYSSFGGEHTVDVHRIFKNFDADENDPAAYTFDPTDKYVSDTISVGTKVFIGLGQVLSTDINTAHIRRRILKSGQEFASILLPIITKAGRTALIIILNIGKSGMNPIAETPAAQTTAGRVLRSSLLSFIRLRQSI